VSVTGCGDESPVPTDGTSLKPNDQEKSQLKEVGKSDPSAK
jgi:hypothetical protein